MHEGMIRLEPRVCLSTVLWDGGGDGSNWTDPLNWDTDSLPDGESEVVIDIAGEPIVRVPANEWAIAKSVRSREKMLFESQSRLEVAEASVFEDAVQAGVSFTLSGDGPVDFLASFEAASVVFDSGGAITIGPSGEFHLIGYTTIRRAIHSAGSTEWRALVATFEGGAFVNAGTLTIDTLQTIEVRARNSAASFDNAGHMVKTGTGELFCSDTSISPLRFRNTGTVDVRSGRLTIGEEGDHTGTFAVQTGALLAFTGEHAFAPSATIAGGGVLEFRAVVTLESTVDIGEFRVSSDSVGVHAPFHASQGVTVSGGTLNMFIPWTFDNVRLYGGGIGGTADIEFEGLLDWTRGGIGGTGARRFAPGSTVLISGTAGKGFGTPVVNETHITWTGGDLSSSYQVGRLVNLGSIEVSFQIGTYTLPELVNRGTVHIAKGSLVTTRAIVNEGDFTITQGILSIEHGGVLSQPIEMIGSQVTMFIRGADLQIPAGSGITGLGTLNILGAQPGLEIEGDITVHRLSLNGFHTFHGLVAADLGLTVPGGTTTFLGTLTIPDDRPIQVLGEVDLGSNNLRVSRGEIRVLTTDGLLEISGEVEWDFGRLEGDGLLRILPSGTLWPTENYRRTLGLSIENHGLLRWPNNTIEFVGATVENFGLIEAEVSTYSRTEGPGAIINHGTLRNLGPGGLNLGRPGDGLSFTNSGEVIIQQGDILVAESLDVAGELRVLLRGTWEIGGGTDLQFGDGSPIRVIDEGALVRLRDPGSAVVGLEGIIALRGGLELLDGARLIASTDQGWLTQSGRLRVGIDSWLLVRGALHQTGTAVTEVEVAGTLDAELGRVRANGAIWLGGRLELDVVGAYTPAEGAMHEIVTAPIVGGEFSEAVLPEAQTTDKWALRYDAGGVTAVHTDIADMNLDGVLNTTDAVFFFSLFAAHDPRADLDGDGIIGPQDVMFWLSAWADG
jgi:hypothetical protein